MADVWSKGPPNVNPPVVLGNWQPVARLPGGGGKRPAAPPIDPAVAAILDKAIRAIGGEEKLRKVQAVTWKSKGTAKYGKEDSRFTAETIAAGTTHLR